MRNSNTFIFSYITNDTELTRSITVGTFGQNQGYTKGQKVWFVEFKVIAINDLRAAITDKHNAVNPLFIILLKKLISHFRLNNRTLLITVYV